MQQHKAENSRRKPLVKQAWWLSYGWERCKREAIHMEFFMSRGKIREESPPKARAAPANSDSSKELQCNWGHQCLYAVNGKKALQWIQSQCTLLKYVKYEPWCHTSHERVECLECHENIALRCVWVWVVYMCISSVCICVYNVCMCLVYLWVHAHV